MFPLIQKLLLFKKDCLI